MAGKVKGWSLVIWTSDRNKISAMKLEKLTAVGDKSTIEPGDDCAWKAGSGKTAKSWTCCVLAVAATKQGLNEKSVLAARNSMENVSERTLTADERKILVAASGVSVELGSNNNNTFPNLNAPQASAVNVGPVPANTPSNSTALKKQREIDNILQRERADATPIMEEQRFEGCELVLVSDLAAKDKDLAAKDKDLAAKDKDLAAKDKDLAAKDKDLAAKDKDLAAKDKVIKELGEERDDLLLRVAIFRTERDQLSAELINSKQQVKASEDETDRLKAEILMAAGASTSGQNGSSDASGNPESGKQSRPAGVMNAEVAKQFQMKELAKGSGVYVTPQQRYIIKSAGDLTYCLSAAMNCFYSKAELRDHNLTGHNGKKKLDERIITAIVDTAHHLFPDAKGKNGKLISVATLRSRLVQRCHDGRPKTKRVRDAKGATTEAKKTKTPKYIDSELDTSSSDDDEDVERNAGGHPTKGCKVPKITTVKEALQSERLD